MENKINKLALTMVLLEEIEKDLNEYLNIRTTLYMNI